MTRLIDADGLIKTLNEKNIPVDIRVNYQIMNAPTIEPDGDTISRQAVIELIKDSYYDLAEMDDVWAMVHDVEQLPSAPDSRQRGEWADNHNGTFVCDQCGCKHSKSNFCPNCGAKMGGDEI